jgi:hypothetical protein
MLRLQTWKSQKEVDKTFEVDGYDLMWGTIEDILQILDDAGRDPDETEIARLLQQNRNKINEFLQDVFPTMTDADLRKIKIRDIVPFFISLFAYVQTSFTSKN